MVNTKEKEEMLRKLSSQALNSKLYAFKLLLLCILVLICSFSLPNNYYAVKIR